MGEGISTGRETSICVLAYEDSNLNRLRDTSEQAFTGMKISLNQDGGEVQAIQSGAVAENCFRAVAPGVYTLRAEAPSPYGLTTPAEIALEVPQGAALQVSFGAATGFLPTPTPILAVPQAPAALSPEELAARSPLVQLAIDNAGVLVLGLAVLVLIGGLFAAFMARRG